jgi:hypothetical protein
VIALLYKDPDAERLRYLSICVNATSDVLTSAEVDINTKLECAKEFVEVARILAEGRCQDEPV